MSFQYLPLERIRTLHGTFISLGLATPTKIESLLNGVNVVYVASLDRSGAPSDSLFNLLNALNSVERLLDGTVPFLIFLGNAEILAAGKDRQQAIHGALDDVSARASTAHALPASPADPIAPTAPALALFPGALERAKDDERTDMLPFSFLEKGAKVGIAVARIQVPRFENGQPVLLVTGEPRRYLGTAWLLAPDLIITNHHVINARDDDEPAASAADLQLQALGAVAQFDFDSAEVAPTDERVKALEAFSPLTGPLDYAILRLVNPQPARPALQLRRAPTTLPEDVAEYPSLNIIQHPQGGPKMVAFRNNNIYRATATEMLYFTDTQRGSSGSPVLDDQWQVVALHKKWKGLTTNATFQGKTAGWVNVGTQISAILADLHAGAPTLLAQIA
jgi:V8-like Glu-specific endopeptidase